MWKYENLLYVGRPGFTKHMWVQRDMLSPAKDIRSNIIARLGFYFEQHFQYASYVGIY